ncbi:MAG: tetratricopeptide repeat protein [Planctomycetota bacterium]
MRFNPVVAPNRGRLIAPLNLLLALGFVFAGCSKPTSKVYRFDAPENEASRLVYAQEAYEQGVQQILAGELDAARQNLETATRLDPNHGRGFNNLGWVYYRQGRFYHAARAFQAAGRLLPDHAAPLSNLGLTMAAAGRWDDAVEFQNRALELDPDNTRYRNRLAFAQVKRGDRLASLRTLLETVLFHATADDWSRWAQALLEQIDRS